VSVAAIGMATAVAAALALYAASPQQRLTRRNLPGAALGWGGLVGLAASLAILLQWAGPATAVFIMLTLATLVWTLVPPAAAWLRRPKGNSK
jgi:hypothetical protein